MVRKKLLVLLKTFDVLATAQQSHTTLARSNNTTRISQILGYLDSRNKVHNEAVGFCTDILRKKSVDWEALSRCDLSEKIRNVDLVVTIGGDGTLLHASHFMDDTIPVLGVNSDPTKPEEVKQHIHEFDATRSTGYLCAATINDFEKVLDDILEGRRLPSRLSRILVSVNSKMLPIYALNDIIVAHTCPAGLSRFSFKIKKDDQSCSPLVNSRSSGLRVSTAAGSSAAMLSAGGFLMPICSQNLQYMVREPISPGVAGKLMHGVINSDQSMDITWTCDEGMVYIDGSHNIHPIRHGDSIEVSSKAPILKVFLSQRSSL